MAELVKVVVDAMGGDLAPVEPVKAAVEAVKERKDILVILTGQEEVIHSELKKYQDYPTDRIQVVNATEGSCRRSGSCWQKQRCGTSASGSVDSHS